MGLQSFDFFRKIQSEQELSSSTGGIFTIASLAVSAILILLSINDFTSVQYSTSLVVKNDPNQYLPTTIDIIFDKAPCQLISIKFHDELQFIEPHIQKKLNLSIIEEDKEKPYTPTDNHDQMVKRAEQGIKTKKQCRVSGTLNLPKTPGTLTFDVSGPNNLLHNINAQFQNRVRATYLLKTLIFGDGSNNFDLPISHRSVNLQKYINELQGNIKSRKEVQDFRGTAQRFNYYNHLKIIPIFVDDGTFTSEIDKQKYRFSLRAGKAITRSEAPILQIYTQIEPINIVYKKQEMTVYDLAIDILAIVGGSVATIGVMNSISHALFGLK